MLWGVECSIAHFVVGFLSEGLRCQDAIRLPVVSDFRVSHVTAFTATRAYTIKEGAILKSSTPRCEAWAGCGAREAFAGSCSIKPMEDTLGQSRPQWEAQYSTTGDNQEQVLGNRTMVGKRGVQGAMSLSAMRKSRNTSCKLWAARVQWQTMKNLPRKQEKITTTTKIELICTDPATAGHLSSSWKQLTFSGCLSLQPTKRLHASGRLSKTNLPVITATFHSKFA